MQEFYKLIAPPAKPPAQRGKLARQTYSSEFPRCPSPRAPKQHVFVVAALLGIVLLAQSSFSKQLPADRHSGRLEVCAATKSIMPTTKNLMSDPAWSDVNFHNPLPSLWGSTFVAWGSPRHHSDLPQVGIAPID